MLDIRSFCDVCARLFAFGLMSGVLRTKAAATSGTGTKKSLTSGIRKLKNSLTSKWLSEEMHAIRLVRIKHSRLQLYSLQIKYGQLLCFCSRHSANLFMPRLRKTETQKNPKLSMSSLVRKVSYSSEASSTRTHTSKSKSFSVIH